MGFSPSVVFGFRWAFPFCRVWLSVGFSPSVVFGFQWADDWRSSNGEGKNDGGQAGSNIQYYSILIQ